MKCIIVDDEPIAREGMESLISKVPELNLIGAFESAESASIYLKDNTIDLIFLDINMPGINGIEFAHSVPRQTLIIFASAYSSYGVDSYEVDAIDYLAKPIDPEKFNKAVHKAITYHTLLLNEGKNIADSDEDDFIFVKSGRKFIKVNLSEVLFIEALKDYVIIQTEKQQVTTRMTLKAMTEFLPESTFFRINKSFLINKDHIDSYDNNDVHIKTYEIAIGSPYKDEFFRLFESRKL